MTNYTYRYLTSDQAQQIVLTSLAIRPMTEDELCQVVKWADNAALHAGMLENVYRGLMGLAPGLAGEMAAQLLPRGEALAGDEFRQAFQPSQNDTLDA